MGLVIAVYTKEAFKEYVLPAINNADYSLVINKDVFNLRKDRNNRLRKQKNRAKTYFLR